MRYASIVQRVQGLGGAVWNVHNRAVAMGEAGEDVVLLSLGEPDFDTPPEIVDAAIRALRQGRTKYADGQGEPALRRSVAANYSKRSGRRVDADQVLFLPGTQTALFLTLLGLAQVGDDVLVPDPFYATYPSIVAATGARLVTVPLAREDSFHLRSGVLEDAIRPESSVLLLNTPHNPTGAVLSRRELTEIARVVTDHDLWVVCDEVYASLVRAPEFASMFDIPTMADRTVVVSSLSKSHAMTGWRCGWAVGPAEFVSRLTPLAESVLFGSQPFLQDAATWALSNDIAQTEAMRESYDRRIRLVIARLASTPGIACLPPDAGMFIMADVSGTGLTGNEFADRLLGEEGVAVMPGSSFGSTATAFIRMSVLADEQRLVEACDRIDRFCRSSSSNG